MTILGWCIFAVLGIIIGLGVTSIDRRVNGDAKSTIDRLEAYSNRICFTWLILIFIWVVFSLVITVCAKGEYLTKIETEAVYTEVEKIEVVNGHRVYLEKCGFKAKERVNEIQIHTASDTIPDKVIVSDLEYCFITPSWLKSIFKNPEVLYGYNIAKADIYTSNPEKIKFR